MKSLLNWQGGKSRIARLIISYFPTRFSRYFEPFVGGGSVFGITQFTKSVLSDKNIWLIDAYRGVRDQADRVIEILASLDATREVYERVKQIHPAGLSLEYRSAHLIYLNKYSFGNSFRLDNHGFFSVPYRNPKHLRTNYFFIQEWAARLQGVELRDGDFAVGLEGVGVGDLVYLDPPDAERRVYGYRSRRGPYEFSVLDYERLTNLCHKLDRQGVTWFLSDRNTSLIRIMLSGYRIIALFPNLDFDDERQQCLITNYQQNDTVTSVGFFSQSSISAGGRPV